ncbi:hypothetical protein BLNAU_24540 [Blattamonas nauphoetae]|uniref:Uncharacterized protein n=1 Tax=Blattamonas nauphoetae TaxID=2049346 RepID=A0ABQ9WM59_9EUKA|nr:hypothetical protein BLNAU_24540 [Blattamonas nauphoetae]
MMSKILTHVLGVATIVPHSFVVKQNQNPFFTAVFSLPSDDLIKHAFITCSQEQRLALEQKTTSFQFIATITGFDPINGYPHLTLHKFSRCPDSSAGDEYEQFLSECGFTVHNLPRPMTGSTIQTARGIVLATDDSPEMYCLNVDGLTKPLTFSEEERPHLAILAESCEHTPWPRELKVAISNSDGSKMILRLINFEPNRQPFICYLSDKPIVHRAHLANEPDTFYEKDELQKYVSVQGISPRTFALAGLYDIVDDD